MTNVLNTFRRRWWLVVLAPAVALLVVLPLVDDGGTTYTADATFFVPNGAGGNDPGGPNEAARLAQQYATLIPADARIVQQVADAVGTDLSDARERLHLSSVSDSSLVRASFRGGTSVDALTGIDALVGAVVAGQGQQTSIPAGFLEVVDQDQAASAAVPSRTAPLAAALLGGLVLGIGGAFALERTDVRVDDVELAVRRTGVPGSHLDSMVDPSVAVLLRHWQDLGDGTPIALLGTVPGQLPTTNAVAARLRGLGEPTGHDDPTGPAALRVGGAPGSVEGGEWIAAESSLSVLVVPRGTPLRHVEHATDSLRKLDLGPDWLVTTKRSPRPGRARRAEPQPLGAPEGHEVAS